MGRNRTVTETLSLKEDLGQDGEKAEKKNGEKNGTNGDAKEFDTLELRNRTVTETLSPVADLGQDKKEENGTASNGKKAEDAEKFDKLELRNRTVTETLSPVEDLGQDKKKDNEDEPDAKKQKFDTLSLRNRDVTETLFPFLISSLSTTETRINHKNNIAAILHSLKRVF